MGIVVLGAGGRLGTLLRPVLPGKATWLTRADVDICDDTALRTALRAAQTVICMAGVATDHPEQVDRNIDLAKRTLDAAAQVGAGRVLLFSSAAVYGNAPGCLSEDHLAVPVSSYGKAKRDMERMAATHRHSNTVLRLGNVAGADAILFGWQSGFALDQLTDGTTPRRSYIGPNALARTLWDLAAAPSLPARLNVAGPGCVQMGALLDAAGLAWTTRPATPATIPSVNLDITRLRTFIDFKAWEGTPDGIVADWQNRLS